MADGGAGGHPWFVGLEGRGRVGLVANITIGALVPLFSLAGAVVTRMPTARAAGIVGIAVVVGTALALRLHWPLGALVVALLGVVGSVLVYEANPPLMVAAEIAVFTVACLRPRRVILGILAILGVLAITGEYSSGMIRASLAAVPRRLPVLWGKAVVIGVVSLLVSVPAAFAAFFVGQRIFGDGANASLSDPGVTQSVVGTGVYLAAIAVLGLAIGALLRHAAGAIGTLFGLFLLASGLLPLLLPNGWSDNIVPYLPSNAGAAFTSVHPAAGLLSAGAGAAVLAGWIVVLLGAAAVLLKRRDA